MQRIQLKIDKDSIHVSEVNHERGIIVKDINHTGIGFICKNSKGFYIKWTCTDGYSVGRDTIDRLIVEFESMEFYTLSGIRITTEKILTVEDLKDTDHVGFIDNSGYKGYVICALPKQFKAIQRCQGINQCNCLYNGTTLYPSIKQIIETASFIKEVFRFDTQASLYKWLSED